LYLPTANAPIPLSEIDNILIVDGSFRRTPSGASRIQ